MRTIDPHKSFTDLGYCAAIRTTAPQGTLAPYCVLLKDHEQPKHRDPYGAEWIDAPVINGQTSDGYHTFDELYEFRKLYNAALFNMWADNHWRGSLYDVHKSWRHHDGEECFGGGWFIVMATLPTGQISNHYEAKDWDLFRVPEQERADEWDGHTAADVAVRLAKFIRKGAA